MLKDDTLGIGAKKSAQSDECTGLLGLQGLLGRLNGNDKMVEQVKLEEDRKKNEWIESRWGMRFVRGEVWVADDLTKLRERMVKEREGKSEALKAKEEKEKGKGAEEKSSSSRKKRKRDTDDGEKDKKESKKSKSRDKKKKSKQRDPEGDGAATPATDRESKSTSASGDETESKEERRRRRNEEKRLKNERKENRGAQKKEKKEKKERKKKRKASSDSDSSSESETEPASGSVTPASAMNGRHALRHRFIAAKRSAMMDAASLNEVGLRFPISVTLEVAVSNHHSPDSHDQGIRGGLSLLRHGLDLVQVTEVDSVCLVVELDLSVFA